MSDTHENERPLLARTFESMELAADGRNVEMLCVPFDSPTEVADPPDWQPYQEELARGAFVGATKAPNRVLLDFEHYGIMPDSPWPLGLAGVLGHGDVFEERDDALYGRFRVTEHPDGDKALRMIHDGILTGASVLFRALRSARSESGVMRRLKVHLDRVALCRTGAYPDAKVLAVRSKVELPEPVRLPFDPDLAEYLSAKGIAVPDRLRPATQ